MNLLVLSLATAMLRRRRTRPEQNDGDAAATPASSEAPAAVHVGGTSSECASPPSPRSSNSATSAAAGSTHRPTTCTLQRRDKSPTHLALLGMLYSLILRTLSFLLNIITKRFVSPDTLGKSDVTLDLLLSTTLFLAREGFRLGLGRGEENGDGLDNTRNGDDSMDDDADTGITETKERKSYREQRLANTAYLSIVSGFVASAVALGMHLHHCHGKLTTADGSEDVGATEMDYLYGGILYTMAALLEMLSEPYQIFCLRSLDVDTRAAAEGAGNLGRAVVNVLLLGGLVDRLLGSSLALRYPVSCFGAGHIVHAILLGGVFRWRKKGHIRRPRFVTGICVGAQANAQNDSVISRNFDLASLRLIGIFSAQSLFKHLLTEGDRIVLTLLGSSYDRGVYGMASSIGGIASRMLLQPVEENARLLFGRLGSELESAERIHRSNKLETLQRTYITLIKMVLYFGLVFASLGSNYTSILLRILAGSTWGSNEDATAALSAFCIYTALLALNGTTEAFVYGVASTYKDVGMLSTVHAAVTVTAFGIVAPILVGWYGTVGLVGANCLAMALRSLYSISFAAAYFCRQHAFIAMRVHEKNTKMEGGSSATAGQVMRRMSYLLCKILPRGMVLLSFLVTYLITNHTREYLLAFEKQMVEEQDDRQSTIRITSKIWLLSAAKHVGMGVFCAIGIALMAYKLEGEARRDAQRIMTTTNYEKKEKQG